MIDQIAAPARRPPFQAYELRYQPRIVEKPDTPGIQQRQEIPVDGALGIGRLINGDPLGQKSLFDPTGTPTIGHYLAQPVISQVMRKGCRHRLWLHRRPDFPQKIEHKLAAPSPSEWAIASV